MSRDENWVDFEEAIKLVMQRTGKNRRQARAALMEHCRSGKLPARAYDLETGEDIGPLPPEVFPPTH